MVFRQQIASILDLDPDAEGIPCEVQGWVRSRRDSKAGVSFIDCSDGSCMAGLQVVAPAELDEYQDVVLNLHTGCAIRAEGLLVPSQGRGQRVELQARRIDLVGDVDPECYPIQKQATSLEFLRTVPHLRARTRTMQAVMRIRSHLSLAIHRFFADRGFLYLHTPIITAADCEGAGELFRVTTRDSGQAATTEKEQARDFFHRATYLTVSGQLEGETYACGMGDVYTFGPTFRAENSNTARHLAEFWMVEPEMAFCDLQRDCDVACAFVKAVINDTLEHCAPELALLDKQHRGLIAGLERLVASEFVRMPYHEAVDRLERSGKTFSHDVVRGSDLGTEQERFLVEQICRKPVLITDWPREIKAFYMRLNDDGETVAAVDMLVPGMGELIGGSQREERLDVLEARMRASGLDPADYGPYLDLRRYGTVPHAGFGLGLERLVCLVTGMQNVRDVVPYPRTPGHCP